MNIIINEQRYEVGIVTVGGTLSLGIYGLNDVTTIYNTFVPETSPEIRIYDDNDKICAIYANRKITGVSWNTENVQVTMVVDPLEVTAETRINEELEAQSESASISDDAIAELAEIVASLEERIAALEESRGENNG